MAAAAVAAEDGEYVVVDAAAADRQAHLSWRVLTSK